MAIILACVALLTRRCYGQVNELIERANQEWDELHPDEDRSERLLPLIRLRASPSFAPVRPPLRLSLTEVTLSVLQVDYSGGPDGNGYFEVGNPQRFGQDFVDKVANPRDVVQFHRKSATRKARVTMNEPDLKSLDAALLEATETGDNSGLEKVTVTSLVHEYLEAQNLNVLSESLIQNAVDEFVGKGDKDAVGK